MGASNKTTTFTSSHENDLPLGRPQSGRQLLCTRLKETMFGDGIWRESLRELFWRALSAARSRLPFYYSEAARIATAHRTVLIEVIVSEKTPPDVRRRHLKRFAQHYTTPASIFDLAQAIRGQKLSALTLFGSSRLDVAADQRLQQKLHGLEQGMQPLNREDVAQSASRERLSDAAVLIAPSNEFDASLPAVFSEFTILWPTFNVPDHAPETAENIATLQQFGKPYDDASHLASKFSDALAKRILHHLPACGWPPDAIPDAIKPILDLQMSDNLYRATQRLVAMCEAIKETTKTQSKASIFCANPALHAAVQASQPAPVWNWSSNLNAACQILRNPPDETAADSGTVAKAQNKSRRAVNKALQRAFTSFPSKKGFKPRLLLAVSERLPTYAKTVEGLRTDLISDFDVAQISVWSGRKNLSKLRAPVYDLSDTVGIRVGNETDVVCDAVEAAMARALFDDKGLVELPNPGVPLSAVFEALREDARAGAQSILGLASLFEAASKQIKRLKVDTLLTLPGRNPIVMVLAAAARQNGCHVVDLQALMVSRMPRYRKPMADRYMVMNAQAVDLYVQALGVSETEISIVGSPVIDAEVAAVRLLNREIQQKALGFNDNLPVITYGLQPFDEVRIKQWAMLIANCTAELGSALCIKLHPAQDLSLKPKLESWISAVYPQLPFCIETTRPFPEVLAATDILITHYSNIALSASGCGIPVLSIRNTQEGVDLSTAGVATTVGSPEELASTLRIWVERLRREASKTNSLRSNYHPEGIYLGDGQALSRIKNLLTTQV